VKTQLRFAALGTLVLVSIASPARSQTYTRPPELGTISGTVLDADGKPVADASVTIQTSDGLHPHATRTDSKGHFEFTRYIIGQYDLRAYANGVFSDWDKRVLVRAKKTTDVTLRLEVQ
jgi:uncharacterized GH25 family protein